VSGILNGKVALITGVGPGGQGEATAQLFAREGASVVVVDINEEWAETCAKRIVGEARFARVDVAKESDWNKAVDLCSKTFGRLDILVNNAAIHKTASLEETTRLEFERFFQVNQLSVYLGMSACLPLLKQSKGCIINVSSIAAANGSPNAFAYSASKWAVRGMTRCAARDLGSYGIRVNCVMPGYIDTDMTSHVPEVRRNAAVAATPIGRIGTPSDVAEVLLFLASNAARFVNGTDVVVDGGLVS